MLYTPTRTPDPLTGVTTPARRLLAADHDEGMKRSVALGAGSAPASFVVIG